MTHEERLRELHANGSGGNRRIHPDEAAACLAGAEALALVETLAYSEICAIPDCDCVFAEAMRAARAATQTTR